MSEVKLGQFSLRGPVADDRWQGCFTPWAVRVKRRKAG